MKYFFKSGMTDYFPQEWIVFELPIPVLVSPRIFIPILNFDSAAASAAASCLLEWAFPSLQFSSIGSHWFVSQKRKSKRGSKVGLFLILMRTFCESCNQMFNLPFTIHEVMFLKWNDRLFPAGMNRIWIADPCSGKPTYIYSFLELWFFACFAFNNNADNAEWTLY